ncbi:6516_t:CDS:2 [Entrophospora sp. SA101]|nr:6516_t:CDS:2 [Entrophospora sp. SA101]CAJ0847527.1 3036_t:CDS:2 [Entrophospora sp. SA101]
MAIIINSIETLVGYNLFFQNNSDSKEEDSSPEASPQLPALESPMAKYKNLYEKNLNETIIGPRLPYKESIDPNTPTKKRIIGPAMMPYTEDFDSYESEQEEVEDIIGPVLPKSFGKEQDEDDSSYLSTTIKEFEERAEKMRQKLESNTKEKTDKSLERGEWMLVPPSSNFLGGSTTSMKSRKFKQKTTDPSSADNSLWTETPAERKERLQKEVITGQKRKRASDKDEDEEMKYTEIDLKRAELVKEYNEHHRPKSLLEQHQENYKKSKKWEKDDVSRRPFDREKDLMSRRPMDSRKRNELLGSATNLGVANHQH